jgi:hypothetical protein
MFIAFGSAGRWTWPRAWSGAPCEGRPARRLHSQGTCGFLIGLPVRPVPNANDPRRKRLLGAPSLESGLTHTSTSIVIFPP